MAGYPPQQHYAAHPQPNPYHGGPPAYGMHPGGPPVHHGYAPMPPPGAGPYQSPYGQGGGSSNGPWHDPHYDHHPPPPSGMHGHPHAQPGPLPPPPPPPPSLPRPGGYGANVQPVPPPSNGVQQPSQRPPPPPHAQSMQHQGQPPPPPPYGAMPPHEYHAGHHPPPHPSRAGPSQQQQQPPPQGNAAGPQRLHQAAPAQSSRPSQATKRANAAGARDKERGGAGAVGTGKAGGGQRRSNQDKQGNARANAAAKADAASAKAEAARAAAEAAEEPIQESKKIRKRKEVVDRIHRVHWDTLENRDLLYNEMQHTLASTGSVLLLSPGLSRPYLLALHRLTLERDAQLRQTALLHAHQVESARTAYEQDRSKVEDEARSAKRAVRERLLAAVEERRKRLREDKEGGEGVSDVLLDSSTRAHATRKLRNKATGSSRRDGGVDMEVVLSSRGKASGGANGAGGGSLGLSLGSGAAGAATGTGSDAEGPPNGKTATAGEGGFSQPLLSSLMELTGMTGGGANGHIAALPPSNFDALTSGAATATLLHIGVGGGMGDSSYMAGLRATLQSHGKSKKKTQAGKSAAAGASSANAIGHASNNGAVSGAGGAAGGADGATSSGGGDDEDDEGTRSMAAAAAAAVAAATMLNGAGRLRWDQGKSVGQLTSAKDIEIESDLINIRKVGNKRRRR